MQFAITCCKLDTCKHLDAGPARYTSSGNLQVPDQGLPVT